MFVYKMVCAVGEMKIKCKYHWNALVYRVNAVVRVNNPAIIIICRIIARKL